MKTIALVGNPNAGKTTIFNALTGTNQHTGNWPGVTVEKKEGIVVYKNEKYQIIDLPGTYSLGSYSEDEVVARNYIINESPDVVINVVDASNLERNLYLTTQLMELNVKTVIALNMVDEAKKNQLIIDTKKLSKELHIPIVETIAHKKKGVEELKKATIEALENDFSYPTISYGQACDQEIINLEKEITNQVKHYDKNWLSLKLIEKDPYITDMAKENNPGLLDKANKAIERIEDEEILDSDLIIVNKRYEFIKTLVGPAIKRPDKDFESTSDKIDKVLTHRIWGLPIFAVLMLSIFKLTFFLGEDVLGERVAGLFEYLGEATEGLLLSWNAPDLLVSFVANGVFGGLGAVLEFVPLLAVLYLLFGLLEDSGYMARAAYVMDRFMRKFGLQGKTFISMLLGTGCNVPAIMSTRTLESKKDRMIAILINPFISCGAKLEVYLIFIAAFFAKNGALVLFSLYAVGIILALIFAKILSKTLFKGETTDFIMELPPYRMPTLKNSLIYMWDKVIGFIKRAGTLIFIVVSLLWLLAILPNGVEPYSEHSILGQIGSFIAPIFKPAGFGSWQASVGLLSGIVAKEAVVATLGMVYAGVSEGAQLASSIQAAFTPLSAYSYMLMTLLYIPCIGTIAAIRTETNSRKWMWFMIVFTFAIAWLAATIFYQVGLLLGFN